MNYAEQVINGDVVLFKVDPSPKRVVLKDLSYERLESLRKAVIDFCSRSKAITKPMNTWAYILAILNGKENSELWWALCGDIVVGFLVARVYQDLDGDYTAYFQFGWSSTIDGKKHTKEIIDFYKRQGIKRIQFITHRNPKVFQRWLGISWEPVGTLFGIRS